jgi:hypothetical protein
MLWAQWTMAVDGGDTPATGDTDGGGAVLVGERGA